MELKQGTIVKYNAAGIWVQYFLMGDVNGCIIFDGIIRRYALLEDLEALDLPLGLSALGFIEMGRDDPYFPNTAFYRNGNMEIMRNEKWEYFIGDKQIKFANEVQEFYDLFKLLPKSGNGSAI